MEVIESGDITVTLRLTYDELSLIRGCINEALEAVEDWEFHTRVGHQRDRAVAVFGALRAVSESQRPG